MKNIFDYAKAGNFTPKGRENLKVSYKDGFCDIYDENTGAIYQFNESKCQDWVKKSTPNQLFQQLYL